MLVHFQGRDGALLAALSDDVRGSDAPSGEKSSAASAGRGALLAERRSLNRPSAQLRRLAGGGGGGAAPVSGEAELLSYLSALGGTSSTASASLQSATVCQLLVRWLNAHIAVGQPFTHSCARPDRRSALAPCCTAPPTVRRSHIASLPWMPWIAATDSRRCAAGAGACRSEAFNSAKSGRRGKALRAAFTTPTSREAEGRTSASPRAAKPCGPANASPGTQSAARVWRWSLLLSFKNFARTLLDTCAGSRQLQASRTWRAYGS